MSTWSSSRCVNQAWEDLLKTFQVLDEVVGANSVYTHKDSVQWNQKAVEQITKKLVAAGKPYKYVVTSSFLQISSGSGLNVSTISYWNKVTDCKFEFPFI